MDAEIPVLSGHLIVPTQSGFSINRISKKKSPNLKYCLLFRSSRHGIERLEICDSKDDTKNSKIITLENCVKITQDPNEKLINIVTKTGTLNLHTQNEEDLTNWVTVLKSVAFKEKNNTISRTSAIEEDNDLYCSSYNDGVFTVKLIPTETTVRCNLEIGVYNIELTSTEIILKKPKNDTIVIAKWPYRYIRKYGYRDGKFTFEAGRKCDTGEGLFRLDHPNPQQIFRCMSTKMKTMKKLIKGDSMNSLDCGENQLNAALSMEAGSRSPLPPSPNNNQEFDVNAIGSPLNQSSNSLHTGFISSTDSLNLVTTPNGVAPPSKNSIPNKPPRKILIENSKVESKPCEKYRKFQNYEPITPSPTSSSSGSVLKAIADNAVNVKSNNNNLTLVIPSEISKRMQNNINNNNNNNNNNYNNNNNNNSNSKQKPSYRDYESIENITEAWKTLGIDEVKHTEHVTTPEDELVEFVWQRSKSHKELSRLPTPPNDKSPEPVKLRNSPPPPPTHHPPPPPPPNSAKIIIDDNEDRDENYDHLEFFATSTKISSSYKTIITVVPPMYRKQTSQPVTHNDYELIGGPDTQPCRLADDSYLGYGVLRKTSLPAGQIISNTKILNEDGLLDHRQCNGLDYAIVSKPKRV